MSNHLFTHATEDLVWEEYISKKGGKHRISNPKYISKRWAENPTSAHKMEVKNGHY